jgi:hypothetical protein
MVIGVAGDMRTTVDDIDVVTGFGELPRMNGPGETRADNEDRRVQGNAIKQTG